MTTKFSELGITADTKSFSGEKIKIKKLFNEPITVKAYRLKGSNYQEKGTGQRLDLDIVYNGKSHITWTGSATLMEMIQKVPQDKFPFDTVIKEENERFFFT